MWYHLGTPVVILALSAAGVAQDRSTNSSASVVVLLQKLEDKNERVVIDAGSQLTALGPSVAPALIRALRDRHGCQLQWVASGILSELRLEPRLVDATLMDIARGKCKEKDLFLRRSAAFAFDDLTERLEGRPPQVEATPEIVDASISCGTPSMSLCDRRRPGCWKVRPFRAVVDIGGTGNSTEWVGSAGPLRCPSSTKNQFGDVGWLCADAQQ